MRVLHVITGLNAGGAESLLLALSNNLKMAGFEQRIVSLLDEGPLTARVRDNGIECVHLGLSRGRPSAAGFRAMAREIEEYQPDIIHAWMYHACLYATIASGTAKRTMPLLWSIHHAHLGFSHNSLSTLVAAAACGLLSRSRRVHIAYCAESSRRAHSARGYADARATFMPNGYDAALFVRNPVAGRLFRQRVGIPEHATVIGMGGRYDPIKDHATFLEACSIVRRAASEKVVFMLFGEGIDGTNKELAALIERYQPGSELVLAGRLEDMVAAYSALDILVSSSRGEAFPNLICEAMLCEVPCVATDVGDCRTIIGETGYIVPPGAPVLLGKAMINALSLPRKAREELGLSARRRISERYSAEEFLARHISIYAGLVTNGHLPTQTLTDPNAR